MADGPTDPREEIVARALLESPLLRSSTPSPEACAAAAARPADSTIGTYLMAVHDVPRLGLDASVQLRHVVEALSAVLAALDAKTIDALIEVQSTLSTFCPRSDSARRAWRRVQDILDGLDAGEREKGRDPELQLWIDRDVKNMDVIERLEDLRDRLEDALQPFVDSKPMPDGESDRYRIHVRGSDLRRAKAALGDDLDAGERCETCDNERQVDCYRCKGVGTQSGDYPCGVCGGSGVEPCPDCSGPEEEKGGDAQC